MSGSPPRPPLHQRSWPASRGSAIGALVIVHGLSEHGGRYDELARLANREGFDVAAPDLYGHGDSPGARGHVRDFDADHLGAIDEAVRRIERQDPDLPVLLVGHSLGGLIAARWAQTRVFASRLRGLVLISPFVAQRIAVPGWKRAAAALLARVGPSVSLPTGIPDDSVFREPSEAASFAADPLVQRRMSAGHWAAINRELAELRRAAASLETPTLVLVAGNDLVVDSAATLAFAAELPDATVIEYPEAYHNLAHDPVAPRMTDDLLSWAKARIAA